MARYFVDTDVLIFWFQQKAFGQNDCQHHENSVQWLEECEKNKDEIFIPALAYAEFCAVDILEYEKRLELIDELAWKTVAYDQRHAGLSGKIWGEMQKHQKMPKKNDKTVLKFDICIAATAAIHNADALITCNTKHFIGDSPQGIQSALLRLGYGLPMREPVPLQARLKGTAFAPTKKK